MTQLERVTHEGLREGLLQRAVLEARLASTCAGTTCGTAIVGKAPCGRGYNARLAIVSSFLSDSARLGPGRENL